MSAPAGWEEEDDDHALLHEVAALLSPPSAALDADRDLALLNALLDAPPPPDPPVALQIPAVPAPPALPSAAPPPAPPPTAETNHWHTLKTTRERQRAELEYLRNKVVQLEKELVTAAPRAASLLHSASGATGSSSSREREDASWWAAAAQRQHQERTRSEAENGKLRDLALGQIRLAKSLEKVLEKRRMWEGMTRSAAKRPRLQAGEDDAAAFAQLKRALDSRTTSADAIFAEQGLDAVVDETSDAAVTYDDASRGMRLDFKVVQLHPFEFRAFDRAAWRFLRSALLDTAGGAVVEQGEHSLALRLSYAPRPSLPLRVRSVFKRVVESERVVVTWESETESDAEQRPQIRLRERGWGTIEPIRLPNTSVACITRHFTRATPTMEAPGDDGDQQQQHSGPGALTDLLIASYLQSAQLTHQAISDMLVDEQLPRHR